MKKCFLCLAGLWVLATGCTTQSEARARAQAAFMEGRRQAAESMNQNQAPMVFIIGPVRYPNIPWTPDLTLARALVIADYVNPGDPSQIIVTRNGENIPVAPRKLLQGQDLPLLAGDRIEIRP